MKNKKRGNINWKILIACLIIVYAVAFLGSLFTSPNTSTEWYESIKPSITPPNIVFPIAWNIIFFLIAVSLYFVWVSSKKKQKQKIALFFGINFILNILWTLIFFEFKFLKIAFFEIILLWLSILYLVIFTRKINKISSYLLIPYLLWVAFASIINYLAAF